MAEPITAFVARRSPDWRALEALLSRLERSSLTLAEIEQLDLLYRRTSADLARAQASYRSTDATRYLNQLCARAYGGVYRPTPDRLGALKRFYAAELPRLVRTEWKAIAVSGGLMLLGVILGATTVALEPTGVALLVPDQIQETVARGQLWTDTIEGQSASSELAVRILTNNLQVTFQVFAFGLTFGVLTVVGLLANGLHIGALVTHCFQHGLGGGLLVFMAAHGPLELSIIAISGGAGLLLAQGLLLPGERSRAEALRAKGARAVRLVVGCAPILALTGVIEGFVSPGRLFPAPAKIALGLTLGCVFWLWLLRSGRGAGQLGDDGG